MTRSKSFQKYPMDVVRQRLVPGWVVALIAALVCAGCDREASTPRTGRYGPIQETQQVAVAPALPVGSLIPATNALLSVIETELFPATLWRSAEKSLSLLADPGRTGLGGPGFLAYSSPTGIAMARPGQAFAGDQMRENWLLVSFAGSEGWTEWDSPWAAFLQRRPDEIRLETNGVHLLFPAGAGQVALMPLYGYYKPPQKGREMLGRHGLKEKKLLTWEWNIAVARDPLMRLRYWASATRRFPLRNEESVVVDRSRDRVTLRESFNWMEVPDEWGTKPMKIAPISPALGLALLGKRSFPAEFSKQPLNFELPTPYGPFFAVPEVDTYEVSFPLLRYINETEVSPMPLSSNAPPAAQAALEKLRDVARKSFSSGAKYQPGNEAGDSEPGFEDEFWFAKGLPYYDEITRSNVVASLGNYYREDVFTKAVFGEGGTAPDSGTGRLIFKDGLTDPFGDTRAATESNLLQGLWAYAHFAGDHALIRERWFLIRRLLAAGASTHWAGFGRGGVSALADQAPPVIAYARLAYLAGDLDAYNHACGLLVRELVHHFNKQRTIQWFRENQPWHSLEPIPGGAVLTHLDGGLCGWQIEAVEDTGFPGDDLISRRWSGFRDLDVARFYRDHMRAEVHGEMKILRDRWATRDADIGTSRDGLSRVQLHSFLLNAGITNLHAIAGFLPGPNRSPSQTIADCLAVIRSAQTPRFERLIPAAPPSAPVPGPQREVTEPNPHLVQRISADRSSPSPSWPRIVWETWKTPTGVPWTFGEIRTGTNGSPSAVEVSPLSWNTLEWRFQSAH